MEAPRLRASQRASQIYLQYLLILLFFPFRPEVKAEARDEGQSGHSHTLTRGVAEARELKRHLCGK